MYLQGYTILPFGLFLKEWPVSLYKDRTDYVSNNDNNANPCVSIKNEGFVCLWSSLIYFQLSQQIN